MLKYTLLNLSLITILIFIAVTILKTFLIKYAASSSGFKNIGTLILGILCAMNCTAGIKVIFTIKEILNVIKCTGDQPSLNSKLIFLNDQLLLSCILTLIFLTLYLILMKNIKTELIRKFNAPKYLWDWTKVKRSLKKI